MDTKHKKLLEWKTILFSFFILFGAVSLASQIHNDFHQKLLSKKMKPKVNSSDDWKIFTSAASHFQVAFPGKVEEVDSGDTVQYVGKDSFGNLYVAQRFVPDPEMTKGQSSKDMLRTAIKVLVMKDNVRLENATYTEYLRETVAVDFSGRAANRPFKGKVILDKNIFYYLYSVLKAEDQASSENYDKFIKSFQLIDLENLNPAMV